MSQTTTQASAQQIASSGKSDKSELLTSTISTSSAELFTVNVCRYSKSARIKLACKQTVTHLGKVKRQSNSPEPKYVPLRLSVIAGVTSYGNFEIFCVKLVELFSVPVFIKIVCRHTCIIKVLTLYSDWHIPARICML